MQIIASLIITRVISPSDFGVVALVTTFNQIAILMVSSGLAEGLIYKGDNSELRFSSVFYFNIVVAIIFYILFFISSEFIAGFYGFPQLATLIKVSSINILLYAFSYIQRVINQINLNFKLLAYASAFAAIIGSIIGVYLAFNEYGVWSIVILQLSINFIETFILYVKSKWRPTLHFSWIEIKELLSYSLKVLSNNILQIVYDNLYTLIIGKFLGVRPLGFFNRMQTVVYFTTTNFLYSLESVFFPILCSKKLDENQLNESYEKLLRISTFLSSFVLVILITLSNQIVTIILSESWSEGISTLRILSLAFLFVSISYINNSFLKIRNKVNILLFGNVFKKTIGFIILIITFASRNLDTICIGLFVYYLIDALISMVLIKTSLNIPITNQIFYLKNNFILIMVVLGLAYLNSIFTSVYISFLLGLLIVVTVFIFGSILFKTREYLILRQIINQANAFKK